jgi:hypothetical protein
MRYLRKQVLNRRAPYDQRLNINADDSIVMTTTNNLTLPSGTTAQRPASPTNGMLRYNTDVATNGEVELYQAGAWRSLRFKEATQITQQNLGSGDGVTTLFGPLSPAPPITVQNNAVWGPQNLIVIVENVIQLSTTNYLVVQNPKESSKTYTGTNSVATAIGATTINFNTSMIITSVTGTGTTATITVLQLPTNTQVPFAIGATINVTNIAPYNVSSVAVSSPTVTTFSNTAGFISSNVLSMTGTATGTPVVGGVVTSTTIASNTFITAVNSALFTATISTTVLTVTAISSGTIRVGMVITGTGVTVGTYISALSTGIGGTGTYTLNQSATGTPTTGTSYTVNTWQTATSAVVSGIVSQLSYPSAGTGTVTPSTSLGTVASTSTLYVDGDLIGAIVSGSTSLQVTRTTVVITGTDGQFSCATTTLAVGQVVTISGTYGGTGSIAGYINPTNYYIIATNGTTTFTLSTSATGNGITTTAGTPTGLTYIVLPTVSSYVSDPITNALISVTLNRATNTSIIAINTSFTIVEPTNVELGYYLKFNSSVPYGKPVTVLHGFDK